MKYLYRLLVISCISALLVSCQISVCTKVGKDKAKKTATGECAKKTTAKTDEKYTQKDHNCPNWADPETINPYCPKIGNFLDTDLKELLKKAQDAYYAGDYEKAAKYYLALLKYDITDSNSIYNLACCYGLLGKADLAAMYIKRAYKTGFPDVEWIIKDPDFDKVKEEEIFKTTIAGLKEEIGKKKAEQGELIYIKSSTLDRCYVKLPDAYDKDKPHTLIVALHGLGASPESFTEVRSRFEKPDFIFAVPQAPYSIIGEKGYSWNYSSDDAFHEQTGNLTIGYVADVIKELKNKYNVKDVYLFGFSEGAYMSYIAGIEHPELFKGIISFGGWIEDWFDKKLNDSKAINIEEAKKLRIFIAHGTNDNIVKFDEGTKARDILQKLGFDVTFHEFDGGHAVPEPAVHEAEKWLKTN